MEIFNIKTNENIIKSTVSSYSDQSNIAGSAILLIYCVLVMLCQMLTKTLQDKKCCGSSPTALNSQASLDLSFLYKCFPCTSCSIRRSMRSCCSTDCQESLRKFVTCECARTTVYGNTQNLDLICCSI